MKGMIKKLMVVLVSAFLFMGTVFTPVEAKGSNTSGSNGWNPWGGWFWGWGWQQPTQPEPEPEPEVEEPVVEEEEEPVVEVEVPVIEEDPVIDETPEVDYSPITVVDMAVEGSDELLVSVDAPEGAFPAGTEVFAKAVPVEEMQEIIDDSENVEGTVLAAVDITFMLGEEEMQPANDLSVNVSITAKNLIADAEGLDVVHIDSETEEAESVGFFNLDSEEEVVTFDADSFSVYLIVGQARNITAHYGYMDGNTFVPFASKNIASTSTSFPTNGINQNQYNDNNPNTYLIYDFPGYVYKETRLSTENGTIIWPVLHRADTQSGWGTSYNWQYTTTASDTDDTPTWTTFTNNNNNVFVIYEAKSITTGASGEGGEGGGGDDEDIPELPAGKSVEPNGDGTYNVTLSVTGQENQTEEITRASVIVIFDTSNSMNNNMAGQSTQTDSQRRVNIAKTAVNELAETLLGIVDEETGEHLVQMALITFDDTAQAKEFGDSQHYTTVYGDYEAKVNAIQLAENGEGATNWEAALLEANKLDVSANAPTYVIFVSDGDPTFRMSRMNDSDSTVHSIQVSGNTRYLRYIKKGLFGTGRAFLQTHYDAALRVAREIVAANKEFYTVGLSSQGQRMSDLATAVVSADHYYPGNSPDELAAAFAEIASAVRESFGYTEVEIDDGVTELTTVEAEALTGTPKDFVYRKGTNADDPTQNAEWSGAPEATITEDNHVIWNVASIGQLEAGVTYSVTFTVWPSQESYDIIADINNGIIRDAEGNIISKGTPAEAYAAQPSEVRAQIGIVGGVYTLLTNTGANISYKYNGQDGGNEVTVKKEGAMPLDTSFFGIEKDWVNQLPQDSRTAQVLTKKDEDGKYYLVNGNDEWILDDAGNRIEYDRSKYDSWKDKAVYYVDLIITQGDDDYTEVRLTSDTADGQEAWSWDQMFIAPGVITHAEGATSGAIEVLETGHEYSVREKPSESYYWELTAEIYHPMVVNGETLILQEVKENAPAMDNNTFNGNYYCFDNIVYEKLGTADEAKIMAVNHRRSYLNLTKVIDGEDAPTDEFFEYSITITDPNGEDVWFSAQDPEIEGEIKTVKDLDVTGATAEEGDTGFWYAPSGSEFTIKIKAGWNVRFINLVSDTTYEITEVTENMADGFVLESIEATAVLNGESQTYEPEIEEPTITGEIENPNTDYTVTYTNEYLGFFYVYHSADKTVERFPMAVNGVQVTDFNIAERTADGTLYGGYYKDYAGKSSTFDVKELEFTNDVADDEGEDAKAYTYQYIKDSALGAWTTPYTEEKGFAIDPVKDTVYYLKEVPEGYLQPYLHYTYYKANGGICSVWLISDIDDNNYPETGFVIINDDEEALRCKSLTVQTTNGGNSVKLTPKRVFSSKGVLDGYLTYKKVIELRDGSDALLNEGDKVLQYWVTPDGLHVTGTTERTYKGLDNISGAGVDTQTTVDSVITDPDA